MGEGLTTLINRRITAVLIILLAAAIPSLPWKKMIEQEMFIASTVCSTLDTMAKLNGPGPHPNALHSSGSCTVANVHIIMVLTVLTKTGY